ncbi:hypothetical protein [Coralloluteibacterium stylophorae]|uniref:Uncharacterized protein n=1 Tax=Coralloluteibacterium stylophorae TaxID=1776034 RepID=A0A8J7VUJ9_9GAMM|nr:hypothetical protein [Coralloluteibacterium stylophorae]MBS7458946.1 hypothetical protein [Coralloluteibacterium stylophorae]
MHDDIDPGIRRYLAGLPDPQAPERLAGRILAVRGARRRRRALGAALATAACMVTAIALLLPRSDVGHERQLAGRPVVSSPPAARLAQERAAAAEVRAIDRALQAAYARGAHEDELAGLWEARAVQLELLAAAGDQHRAPRPLRI